MIKFSFISIDVIRKSENIKTPENLFKRESINDELELWYTMNFIQTNEIKMLYGKYKNIYNICRYIEPKIKHLILPEEQQDFYIRNEFITLVEFSKLHSK